MSLANRDRLSKIHKAVEVSSSPEAKYTVAMGIKMDRKGGNFMNKLNINTKCFFFVALLGKFQGNQNNVLFT